MSADATLMFNVVDSGYIADRLWELARRLQADYNDVFRYQMGLWGEDLCRSTFPRGVSDATRRKLTKTAVGDVTKVFMGLNDIQAEWTPIGKEAGYHGIRLGSGAVVAVEEQNFRLGATMSALNAEHQAKRIRKGRVAKGAGRAVRVAIGGAPMTLVDKIAVAGSVLNTYIREVAQRVGRAKAGWLGMVRQYRARMPGEWISRHERRGEWQLTESVAVDGIGMVYENRVPYSSDLARGIIAYTMRIREMALHKLALLKTEKVVAMFNRLKGKGRF